MQQVTTSKQKYIINTILDQKWRERKDVVTDKAKGKKK
ncbi:hypothetical protein [Pseudomonas phage vB_PaeM_PS119XW]|uniref:Uncharacterized protein n=1 Tax=Pseudomonas phage vB_PaeM_PS119XW TaxID=2601632 RepID=A0A5C1K833_9CAUD|nr:hypothetical protein PP933_gp333 [Pseudomonas phage vB_PaeM_PS119XW]QEM42062.1 hypothetical protein [Pseudomonas phage vB_PaeM_PS119XW]